MHHSQEGNFSKMKRIDFIKSFISLTGFWFIKPESGAVSYTLYSGFIAGYHYYKGPEIESGLHPFKSLHLQREPSNKYDGRAIAVYYGDNKLGYIPRRDNKILTNMLDQNVVLQTRILSIDRDARNWKRVKIEVGMINRTVT